MRLYGGESEARCPNFNFEIFELRVTSFFDTYLFLSDMFFRGKQNYGLNFLSTHFITDGFFLRRVYFSTPILLGDLNFLRVFTYEDPLILTKILAQVNDESSD